MDEHNASEKHTNKSNAKLQKVNWPSVVSIINLNLQFNATEMLFALMIRSSSVSKLNASSLDLENVNFAEKISTRYEGKCGL